MNQHSKHISVFQYFRISQRAPVALKGGHIPAFPRFRISQRAPVALKGGHTSIFPYSHISLLMHSPLGVRGLLIFLIFFASCKKETRYSYKVNPVTVQQEGSVKKHTKTTIEFISIAYSDLFGTSITNNDLQKLNVAYTSFGDKKLIEDMIIRNFLNAPGVKIPAKAQMRNDVPKFVSDTYKKLFNRLPNEYEKYLISNKITNDTSITPEQVYYAMMTANEYRYY